MVKLTDEQIKELEHDLDMLMAKFDPRNYHPCAKDFMSMCNIALMLHVDRKNKQKGGHYNAELVDARDYEEMFKRTGDRRWKEMADDELKHARYLSEMESGSRDMQHDAAAIAAPASAKP